MNQDFVIKGYWFTPDNLEKKIYGTLIYKPYERITLELIGSFDEKLDHLKFLPKSTILGVSTKGSKVTLINCLISNIDNAFANMPEVSYLVHLVAVGDHFTDENSILGFKISARFNLLEKWMNIFTHKIKFEDPDQVILTAEKPTILKFQISKDLLGKILTNNSYDIIPKPDFKFSQVTFLELESTGGPININAFIKKLFHFRNFLMMGIGEEISLISLILFSEEEENKTLSKSIEIYFSQNKPKDDLEKLTFHDFMFTFKDIKDDFELIICNWFNILELETITTLIYLFYQNRKSYSENLLLDGVLGLEVFHRRLRQDTKKLKDDFKEKMERICENLNKTDAKFLTEKLEFGYEPNLRRRLRELISELDDDLQRVIFKDKIGKKRFIDRVTNSRNYYTHYSDSSRTSIAKGKDLLLLAKKTNFLLIIILLKEIGFSIDMIKKSLDNFYNRVSYFLDK